MTEFNSRNYFKQRLEKEIDELIEVAETFYKRIKKWNPDISESEAKKIALNIATSKAYEPRLDISTDAIENRLQHIVMSLDDICEKLEKLR
jgi:hypothetical protein